MERLLFVNVVIIILAVILAVVGIVGGKWFWQKMEESPVFAEMRKYVRIVGAIVTSILFILFLVVIVLIWMLEMLTPECRSQVITWVNFISWFFCFYILGYDTSLFRPQPPGKEIPVTTAGEGSNST